MPTKKTDATGASNVKVLSPEELAAMAGEQKTPEPFTLRKADKVIILGSASSTAKLTPFDDKSYDIWALAWRSVKRADVIFDIHPLDHTRKKIPKDYTDKMNADNVPVVLQEARPDVPKSITFPLEQAITYLRQFDPDNFSGRYFVCSLAYMFVLAMMEGYKEIHIYGVDLICDDEYSYQKPNFEYLIGLARGAGIKVHIPTGSALVQFSHLYGYEQPPKNEGFLDKDDFIQRLNHYKKVREEAMHEAHAANGAVMAMDELIGVYDAAKRGADHKPKKEEN